MASRFKIFRAFKKAELEILFSTVKFLVKNLIFPSIFFKSSILFHWILRSVLRNSKLYLRESFINFELPSISNDPLILYKSSLLE